MDSKIVFQAREGKQVEIFKTALKACAVLMETASAWKQKVVNVRFADAVNKALKDAGIDNLTFSLGRTDYVQRFKFFVSPNDKRYVPSVNAYVSTSDFYLTKEEKTPYLTDTNRLDQVALQRAVDEETAYLSKRIATLEDEIQNYDTYKAEAQRLVKQFEEGMKNIPSDLRPKYSIGNYF